MYIQYNYTQINNLVVQEREWSAPYAAEERVWSAPCVVE